VWRCLLQPEVVIVFGQNPTILRTPDAVKKIGESNEISEPKFDSYENRIVLVIAIVYKLRK
jgi:hypothetical protein